MTTTTRPRRARRGEIEGKTFTRNDDNPGLADMISHGRRAVAPSGGVQRPDGQFVRDTKRRPLAGLNGVLSLRAMLPDLLDSDGHIYRTPAATPAQGTRTLRAAVMENSRVVRAGAKLIEIAEPELRGTTAEPVWAEHPTRFSVIQPASFAAVSLTADAAADAVNGGAGTRDEGTVTASPLPVSTAELDRSALTQRAVRFEIPRSTLRQHSDGEIEAEAMQAIALGLGRAVDSELLGALAGVVSPAFTPSAAAAAGVRWGELRAIVGTNGSGIDLTMTPVDAGALHVRGVPGELSPDLEKTLVGAFARFAVAVEPEVDVLVERTRAGALIVTAWADFAALIPDASFAWAIDQ